MNREKQPVLINQVFDRINAAATTARLIRFAAAFALNMAVVALCLIAASQPLKAQDDENPDHPDLRRFDTLTLSQRGGPSLQVIGYGRFQLSYSETVDGYTIVRNDDGIYEYAERASGGDLKPSGTVAHNPGERESDERRLLEDLPKHLRYRPPKLKKILDEQNRFFRLDDK